MYIKCHFRVKIILLRCGCVIIGLAIVCLLICMFNEISMRLLVKHQPGKLRRNMTVFNVLAQYGASHLELGEEIEADDCKG